MNKQITALWAAGAAEATALPRIGVARAQPREFRVRAEHTAIERGISMQKGFAALALRSSVASLAYCG